MLYSLYDLEVSPTGFDFVTYLALSEITRRKAGFSTFKIFIIPAKSETGFWNIEKYSDNEKRFRINNLLIPLADMFPNCSGIEVLSNRNDVLELIRQIPKESIFPFDYNFNDPPTNTFHWAMMSLAILCGDEQQIWSAPDDSLAYIDNLFQPILNGRKLITITLREAEYHTQQNSNLPAWAQFCQTLNSEEYLPVIIRDTAVANQPLPEYFGTILSLPEAAINIKTRTALMQKADYNFIGPCGPMLLSWNNPSIPSLTYGFLNYGSFRNTPTPLRSLGLEPGYDIPGLSPRHKLDWSLGTETVEIITNGFNEYKKFIPRAEHPLTVARRWRKVWAILPSIKLYSHIKDNYDVVIKLASLCGLSILGAVKLPLEEIITINPEISDNYVSCLEIGDYLLKNNAKDQAVMWYNRALLINPGNPEALHALGRVCFINGELNLAYKLLQESIKSDPFTGKTYYDLGEVLLIKGEDSKAADAFHMATINEPSHEAARSRLIERGIKPHDWEGLTLGEVPNNGANDIELYLGKGLSGEDIYYKNGLFYSSGLYSYSMAGILRELARKGIVNGPS